ncbi:hypothetical protein [Microbacterium sp. BR1]|uniref:hypothetical protein n=1 Tax=Microbacterium sp. BR1 TaxID=1070896 RepID=UPI0012FDC76F|nr:hypothetical protein [Microbacterium sp. BR1]
MRESQTADLRACVIPDEHVPFQAAPVSGELGAELDLWTVDELGEVGECFTLRLERRRVIRLVVRTGPGWPEHERQRATRARETLLKDALHDRRPRISGEDRCDGRVRFPRIIPGLEEETDRLDRGGHDEAAHEQRPHAFRLDVEVAGVVVVVVIPDGAGGEDVFAFTQRKVGVPDCGVLPQVETPVRPG